MKGVQEKIGASKPYICGGAPRDKYLNNIERMADLDITTGDNTVEYLSQEFELLLRKKYNVLRKTMADGHSSIFIGKFKIDFSSNFNDPSVNSYLQKIGIQNPTEMQKEVYSRDFTCNSLLLNIELDKILDPTNRGFKDIDNKIIKTCLSPEITLTSNKNRVIRSVYLASKLGFDIDDSIINFVSKNPGTVKISSNKVLLEKTNDAFSYDADKASYLISKMNLWNYIPITESVYPYYMKYGNGASNVKK